MNIEYPEDVITKEDRRRYRRLRRVGKLMEGEGTTPPRLPAPIPRIKIKYPDKIKSTEQRKVYRRTIRRNRREELGIGRNTVSNVYLDLFCMRCGDIGDAEELTLIPVMHPVKHEVWHIHEQCLTISDRKNIVIEGGK